MTNRDFVLIGAAVFAGTVAGNLAGFVLSQLWIVLGMLT